MVTLPIQTFPIRNCCSSDTSKLTNKLLKDSATSFDVCTFRKKWRQISIFLFSFSCTGGPCDHAESKTSCTQTMRNVSSCNISNAHQLKETAFCWLFVTFASLHQWVNSQVRWKRVRMGREGRRRRGRLATFCLEAAEDPGPTVMLRTRRTRLVKGQKEKWMRTRGESNDNKATRPKK